MYALHDDFIAGLADLIDYDGIGFTHVFSTAQTQCFTGYELDRRMMLVQARTLRMICGHETGSDSPRTTGFS